MFDATEASARTGGVIAIHGAREHNLKDLSLAVPRDCFVVVTGVSGSGKSTLAFDLLFAEGQRRFLDSMNVYARQFVEQLSRPDVDLITGIPPTVSIEQRTGRGGGKSTVATVTEIYHFVRLLFARLGTQYCPECQMPVEAQTRDEVARRLEAELRGAGTAPAGAGDQEPQGLSHRGCRMGRQTWLCRGPGRREDCIRPAQRLRLDRFREHNVEIVVGVLERGRRAGGPAERAQGSSMKPSNWARECCWPSDDDRANLRAFHRTRLPRMRALLRDLGPEKFQLQFPPGLVPALPRLRRAVLSAGRGPGGAGRRHRGIVVRWQEGSRESVPSARAPA